MDIVIDTSVIIAVVANEPTRPRLISLTTGATLFAPASVHWEIGNAFAAMLKRKRITLDQSLRAIEAYHQIPMRFIDVDLTNTLEIAHRFAVYAYDAYVIVCALQLRCDLLALDRGLIGAAKLAGVKIAEV